LALQAARSEALRTGVDEIFIIGGGEIYSMALPVTDRLYLTWIDREVAGDVFFPMVPEGQFQEVSRQEHQENGWNYAWCVADRIK
jgi:dihydrofolate reductase